MRGVSDGAAEGSTVGNKEGYMEEEEDGKDEGKLDGEKDGSGTNVNLTVGDKVFSFKAEVGMSDKGESSDDKKTAGEFESRALLVDGGGDDVFSADGCAETFLATTVGLIEGSEESFETTALDGDIVISIEGIVDGSTEGCSEGSSESTLDGDIVISIEGIVDGSIEG